jgi:hypothetical protein
MVDYKNMDNMLANLEHVVQLYLFLHSVDAFARKGWKGGPTSDGRGFKRRKTWRGSSSGRVVVGGGAAWDSCVAVATSINKMMSTSDKSMAGW